MTAKQIIERPYTEMDRQIAVWDSWWRGRYAPFHEYLENDCAGHPTRREMFRMNMAKKVCEDWASILLNDRTVVSVGDPAGDEFVKRVFTDTGFMRLANRLIERAFAVGTGAAILRIHGCVVRDGAIAAGSGTRIGFEFVDAAHIVPLSVENGAITEAAFVSESIRRGKNYVYVESHTLEDGEYVIKNTVFLRDGEKLDECAPEGSCGVIRTGSSVPLFSIISPNVVNAYAENSGLGCSVFADAMDCLRGVDLAFNNFCRDIRLGGKKVFINQSLARRDENGNVYSPDDVAKQLFVMIGDGDIAERPMITEHNPELRTADNAEAVQCQLDYLSFRCGLGTHHYSFSGNEGRARLTATQYMGERQDMLQNAVKHEKNVEAFLRGVIRALLWCAGAVFGMDIPRDAEITVDFDDAYFTDTESQRERSLRELEAGIITAEEYRKKWID